MWRNVSYLGALEKERKTSMGRSGSQRSFKWGRLVAVAGAAILLFAWASSAYQKRKEDGKPAIKQFATSYLTAIANGDVDTFQTLLPAPYWDAVEKQYLLSKEDIQNTIRTDVQSASRGIMQFVGDTPSCVIEIRSTEKLSKGDFKSLCSAIPYFTEKPDEIWRAAVQYIYTGASGSTAEQDLILDLVCYQQQWYVLNTAVDVEDALHRTHSNSTTGS